MPHSYHPVKGAGLIVTIDTIMLDPPTIECIVRVEIYRQHSLDYVTQPYHPREMMAGL